MERFEWAGPEYLVTPGIAHLHHWWPAGLTGQIVWAEQVPDPWGDGTTILEVLRLDEASAARYWAGRKAHNDAWDAGRALMTWAQRYDADEMRLL